MLEEACVEHNLPYVILGKATSFYKRREVKDCLCFLRWLYNGRDKGSMLRAIQTPSRGLGDKAIQQFEEYCDLVDRAFESSDEAHRPTPLDILLSFTSPEEPGMPLRNETIATRPLKLFKEFARQMQSLHDLAHSEPVDKVLAAVIDTFDLISHFDKTSDSKAEFEERQSNVQELQQATRRYTQDGPCLQEEKISSTNGNSIDELDGAKSPLGAFLDDVALVADIGNNEDVDGKEGGSHNQKRFVVSLMTIHASKGMEFDSVFVVGCEDECFPTTQAIQAGKGSVALAEECRLCYVAMTRAKSNLFLTWRRESSVFAPNSANGFRFVNRNRSRFLDALVGGSKNKKDASAGNDVGTRSNDPNTKSVRRHNVPPYGTSQAYQPRSTTATATTSRRPTTQRSFSTTATRNNNQRVSSIPSSSRGYNSNNVISPRPNNRGGGSLSATQKALQRQRKGVPARVAETSPPRPSSTTSTSMPRRPATSASPRDSPSNGKQAATRRTSTAAAAASATMDSTWFYPVGSSVIHKKFGRGIVLNPPPATSPNDLPVRVKFEDGETRDVSSRGDELRPEI